MNPWEAMLETYGGIQGVIDKIENEGLDYFVVDYIGADAFDGGPLEEAAHKIEDGTNEMRKYLGI